MKACSFVSMGKSKSKPKNQKESEAKLRLKFTEALVSVRLR